MYQPTSLWLPKIFIFTPYTNIYSVMYQSNKKIHNRMYLCLQSIWTRSNPNAGVLSAETTPCQLLTDMLPNVHLHCVYTICAVQSGVYLSIVICYSVFAEKLLVDQD